MNKTFKIVSTLALSAMIAMGASSCANDNIPNTKKPEEKKEQKPEEKPEETTDGPHKVVLTFAMGHFHPGAAFHQSSFPKGVTHVKTEEVFSYEKKNGVWTLSEDSPKAMFVESAIADSGSLNPYGLWVSYFDKDGQEITGTFSENGMIDQYQHFFSISNITDLDGKQITGDEAQITKLFNYVYMDSDPWNQQIKKGAKRVGSTLISEDKTGGNPVLEPLNPLGLKGFFNFNVDRVKFDLKIELLNMPEGKMDNGKPRAFYAPKADAKKVVSLSIPMVVFMSRADLNKFYLASDPDEFDVDSYDNLSEEGKTLVDHIAKMFNMTREQAFKEVYDRLNEYVKDSSTLYF